MKQLNNLKSLGKSILFVLFCSIFFCSKCGPSPKYHEAALFVQNNTSDTLLVKWHMGKYQDSTRVDFLPKQRTMVIYKCFNTPNDNSLPPKPAFEDLLNPEKTDTASFVKVFSIKGKLLKEWSYRIGNIGSPGGPFHESSLEYREDERSSNSGSYCRWTFVIKPEDLSLQHSN